MLLFALVAFITPDALDHMARWSGIARSAMAAQRWSGIGPTAMAAQRWFVAPTVLRWCAAPSTESGTLDLVQFRLRTPQKGGVRASEPDLGAHKGNASRRWLPRAALTSLWGGWKGG